MACVYSSGQELVWRERISRQTDIQPHGPTAWGVGAVEAGSLQGMQASREVRESFPSEEGGL